MEAQQCVKLTDTNRSRAYPKGKRFGRNGSSVCGFEGMYHTKNGVWLSLARAPGLGPGGRRFESCHPDLTEYLFSMREWLSGGAPPCQGGGRGFESRLALFLLAGIA